jgi:hypothetical protein
MAGALGANFARHPVEHAVKVHVLVSGQFIIQDGVLKHDAAALPHLVMVPRRVQAVDLHRPARGVQEDQSGVISAIRVRISVSMNTMGARADAAENAA